MKRFYYAICQLLENNSFLKQEDGVMKHPETAQAFDSCTICSYNSVDDFQLGWPYNNQ
jgi:hypothetical protein